MRNLKVKKIHVGTSVKANDVPALLDKEGVTFNAIDVVNWNAFPYRPEVCFRIGYTDGAILLHYKVKEASVRACSSRDDDPVYEDSCVEFFLSPAGDNVYYNLECNCIGTLLLGGGEPGKRDRATPEIVNLVDRWASLGRTSFEERLEETEWEVALVIPYGIFYKHQPISLAGKDVRANFYKCGDKLNMPHFLSWNPIDAKQPNFHLPEFFGVLHFE